MSDDKMPADWRLGLCTDEIERLRAERDALKGEVERRRQHIALHDERVTRLEAEIERLRAKRDALKADAERYRWLRGDSCPDHSVRWAQWEVRRWDAPQWTGDLRRGDLDAAIDAARSKEQR